MNIYRPYSVRVLLLLRKFGWNLLKTNDVYILTNNQSTVLISSINLSDIESYLEETASIPF